MKVAFIDYIFENKDLIKLSGCRFNISNPFKNQDELIAYVKGCDILCGRDQFVKWDAHVIDSLPDLKCIITRSTGYDHIDWKHAGSKGIPVYNVPGYGRNTVAEFAMGLAIQVSRRIHEAAHRYQNLDYSIDGLMGLDLKGKTAGILGTGAIGQEMIRICNGFSMNVLAYDKLKNAQAAATQNFRYVSLRELFRKSDLISIHLPLTEETHHLINKDTLSLLKPTAIIINTGRGEIVDTEAVIEALRENRLFGVGLDTIENERKKKYDFTGLNAVVTTHMAWYTEEAIARITQISLRNIKSFMNGDYTNCINQAYL